MKSYDCLLHSALRKILKVLLSLSICLNYIQAGNCVPEKEPAWSILEEDAGGDKVNQR